MRMSLRVPTTLPALPALPASIPDRLATLTTALASGLDYLSGAGDVIEELEQNVTAYRRKWLRAQGRLRAAARDLRTSRRCVTALHDENARLRRELEATRHELEAAYERLESGEQAPYPAALAAGVAPATGPLTCTGDTWAYRTRRPSQARQAVPFK